MSARGCTPVEVLSLLHFRDRDLVVRCLELARRNIPSFAPEAQAWEIEIIALCHHHPSNSYPTFALFDCGDAAPETVEKFGEKADQWVREQPLGWLIDASADIAAPSWKDLCYKAQPDEGSP
jgi:hypothetical protein